MAGPAELMPSLMHYPLLTLSSWERRAFITLLCECGTEQEMLAPENCSDFVKLGELQDKIKMINDDIEEKMTEWEELNSKLD